jgi:hypothetical protein
LSKAFDQQERQAVLLHDAAVRDAIRARVEALSASSQRRWGRMSAGQMLWHCNQVLSTSLGDIRVEPRRPPFPVPVLKFMLFRMPWPHGAPTAPEYQADAAHDFEGERRHCLELIDRFTAHKLDEGPWPNAVFGPLTGAEWSRLNARHLDHHLKQFGA